MPVLNKVGVNLIPAVNDVAAQPVVMFECEMDGLAYRAERQKKEELDKINALDLSKECWGMQVARDIFMIGVWTAQRVSDYNNIRKEDVKTETIRSWDEDGNLSERQVRTIHVVQQKTVKKITEAYDYFK